MTWKPELDELRERERMAREMGGPDKVQRQHDGGRLTVRERIDRLVDRESFHEVGAIAGKAEYDKAGQARARSRPPTASWGAPRSTAGRSSCWATTSRCAAARPMPPSP